MRNVGTLGHGKAQTGGCLRGSFSEGQGMTEKDTRTPDLLSDRWADQNKAPSQCIAVRMWAGPMALTGAQEWDEDCCKGGQCVCVCVCTAEINTLQA